MSDEYFSIKYSMSLCLFILVDVIDVAIVIVIFIMVLNRVV